MITTAEADNKSSADTNIVKTKLSSYEWMLDGIYTIWLFTADDIKSIVLPETAFGLFSALSGNALTTNARPRLLDIVLRLPQILLWNWLNLLLFNLANQRLKGSIIEDSVNKPWRPLASRRISENSTRRLLIAIMPVVFFSSVLLGGVLESVGMMALTWMYNDLKGADENYIVRNIINALGFMCYSSGSTVVASGYQQHGLTPVFYTWLAMVGGIVFSTLQVQDMPDVEGDSARGRRTLPIVHGDTAARWSIAIPVLAWSIVCPVFWRVGLIGWLMCGLTGGLLSYRVLILKSVSADRTSWKLWCLWTSCLYLLPLVKKTTSVLRS